MHSSKASIPAVKVKRKGKVYPIAGHEGLKGEY
jgi:hypothetical protein